MKKVVIIGAGPAGLSAAHDLLHKQYDCSVLVLEASDSIGGISRTVQYHGNRMDIGGHRFFSKNSEVMQWWQERLPLQGAPALDERIVQSKPLWTGEGPDPEIEDKVMLVRRRLSRIFFEGHFFDYPLQLKFSTLYNLGIKNTVTSGISYCTAQICKREEKNLEDFLINRFGKKLYSLFFESYTKKVWGRHPKELSPDWGAQRIRNISLTCILLDAIKNYFNLKNFKNTETSLINEFWYPKFGPGQLWECTAQEIQNMGGKILYNHPVTTIDCKDGKINGVQSQGEFFPADIVISSMPLKNLISSLVINIPKDIRNIANNLEYRDFMTIGVLVPKLLLKNTTQYATVGNIIPDSWLYIQDKNVHVGRVQIFNNWSPYLVQNPKDTVWLGLEYFCNEGDSLWNMPDSVCFDMAEKDLIHLGMITKGDILDAHCVRVQKAYPTYYGEYKNINILREFLLSIDNLYCVGRNGQHRYNNMDHSMLTSFRTVEHICNKNITKQSIWDINADAQYHETTS